MGKAFSIAYMLCHQLHNFKAVKFEVNGSRGRPVSTSTPNSVKISHMAAELWRFVFLKWRPAAILDFGRSEIWRYFCFRDVGFSLWTKFCLNTCNYDRVTAIKVNLQNGGRRHLGFFGFEIWRRRKSRPHQIWWRYLKGRPSYSSLCVFKMVAAAILNLLPVLIFFI